MSGQSEANSPTSFAPPIGGMTTSVIIKWMGPLPPCDGQRFRAILCFQDDVAMQAEKLAGGLPDAPSSSASSIVSEPRRHSSTVRQGCGTRFACLDIFTDQARQHLVDLLNDQAQV